MNPFTRCVAVLCLSCVLAVGLQCDAPRAQTLVTGETVALTGARLIDGTGAPPVERATVILADGRIQAAGPSASVPIPAGATRLDLAGKTIVPGLISSHAHVQVGDESLPLGDRISQQLRVYATYGVTTVVTLGDDGKESVRLRDENDRRPLDRARLYVSGPAVVAQTPAEARQAIDRAADLKVDVVKTRMEGRDGDMTPEVYTALIDQAHKRGLRVAAHMITLKDAEGLVRAGLDVLAHSVRDQEMPMAFLQELRRRDVGYIPTLTREVSAFVYETTPEFFTDPFFLLAADRRHIDLLRDPARQAQVRQSPQTATVKKWLEVAKVNVKRAADAGVTIAMGTDTGAFPGRWQGYFEHVELELMVESGMTPMQALTAATGGAARVMRLDRLGTIRPGNRADLLVLSANPLADITNTRTIESVWLDGRRLNRLGTN